MLLQLKRRKRRKGKKQKQLLLLGFRPNSKPRKVKARERAKPDRAI